MDEQNTIVATGTKRVGDALYVTLIVSDLSSDERVQIVMVMTPTTARAHAAAITAYADAVEMQVQTEKKRG